MPPEHKPTAHGTGSNGAPAHPNQLCSRAMLQSLDSLFAFIAAGDTLTFCPQAAEFSKELCTAARTDNGHVQGLISRASCALWMLTFLHEY